MTQRRARATPVPWRRAHDHGQAALRRLADALGVDGTGPDGLGAGFDSYLRRLPAGEALRVERELAALAQAVEELGPRASAETIVARSEHLLDHPH